MLYYKTEKAGFSWIIGSSQALYSVTILHLQNLHSISLFTGTWLDLTTFGRRTCQNPLEPDQAPLGGSHP